MPTGSFFTVSLDVELFWGVRDVTSIRRYGKNVLGVRQAIPAMLALFRSHGIHATWATVGFVTFATRKELLSCLPEERPCYLNPKLDPYRYLPDIGDSERDDPYHYGHSLVRAIQDTPGMEIGSHSFSHFYCLEERANPSAYRADLQASVAALQRLNIQPRSLVFCRNQYDSAHLQDAAECGFEVFRGNESGFLYSPRPAEEEILLRRAGRLADAYFDFSGPNLSAVFRDSSGMMNVPSSRFLRPVSSSFALFERLRLKRIQSAMEAAAISGSGFHLWWHPHNFGINLAGNLSFLSQVLSHFRHLQDKFGMQSVTMAEAAGLEHVACLSRQGS
jgi:peptidoglycan/xylan/chitin deacetylase (PgdA/CDA1 family)